MEEPVTLTQQAQVLPDWQLLMLAAEVEQLEALRQDLEEREAVETAADLI
jgi:hypothetical protein